MNEGKIGMITITSNRLGEERLENGSSGVSTRHFAETAAMAILSKYNTGKRAGWTGVTV